MLYPFLIQCEIPKLELARADLAQLLLLLLHVSVPFLLEAAADYPEGFEINHIHHLALGDHVSYYLAILLYHAPTRFEKDFQDVLSAVVDFERFVDKG